MDWGFATFCPTQMLQDQGFLRPPGELRIRVEMTVSLNEHVGSDAEGEQTGLAPIKISGGYTVRHP